MKSSENYVRTGGGSTTFFGTFFLQRLKMFLDSADTAEKFQFVLCTVAVSNGGSVSNGGFVSNGGSVSPEEQKAARKSTNKIQ